MKYKAVIFDLFGTLIHNFNTEEYQTVLRSMASVLLASSDDFIRLWNETFSDRCTGILKSPEGNIEYVCRELGVSIDSDQTSEAALIRYAQTRSTLIPAPGAIETLTRLRMEGYKTGLVTDCSDEAPSIWPDTPFAPLFDVTVFSCQAGIKKPDPRIYRLAAKQLEVEPENCLYVGDGSSQELTGAAAVGMHPVLIRDPEEDSSTVHRVNSENEEWDGPVISTLSEVPDLLK